ncbi:30S ribosomal protein S2 [Bradyrhizobium elkanii]|uniref:30S ribosomal protein S2 n=1 Tax=Bradyrhizobium elkanii TaxID=29448 RepID=UPI0034E5687E
MRQLLEAGVHFGHQAHRWNPKMQDYIFGARNNIHIIDLAQTVPMLHRALQAVSDTVAKGGRILFVGTKRSAQDGVADAAKRSAQYFVNSRWLGGTLTNWKTISASIKRLRHLDDVLSSGEANSYTKKERLTLQRERDKLDRSLGGIKDMGGLPDMIFVIDTNKEDIAIQEDIVRGVEVSSRGVSRPTGDTMGMLATMMNCLALEAAIERKGTPAQTLSAFVMPEISELFTRSATHKYLAEGRIVLLGGGTGNPFFTTDTTAVLRAAEIGAQAVLKATNVDGVYSADPKKDPKAKRFDRLTHSQAIEGGYKVMDATAFALARETSLPIIVFSIAEPGSIGAILRGTGHGTVVAG